MLYLVLPPILAVLAILTIFWGQNLFNSSSAVKYKDEKIEANRQGTSSTSNLLVALGGGVIGAGIAYAITGAWLFTLIGLSGGFLALRWIKEKKERDRLHLLHSQYPDVLSQLESATAGNLNIAQAINDITPNLPRPAQDVFYEVLRRRGTGESLAHALEQVVRKTGWTDLNNLTLGLKLAGSVGINMTEICKHALESYYEKENARGQIQAAVAQNIMTIRLLSGLPFFVVAATRTIAPDFAAPLFNTLWGQIFFICCVLAILAGNQIAKTMVNKTLNV